MQTKKVKNTLKQIFWHAVIIATVIVFLYPFLYMVLTSLKPFADIVASGANIFPKRITFDNYIHTADAVPLLRVIANSFMVATLTMTVKMITSVLGAYALTFLPNKYSNKVFYFFIITMFVPFSVIMLPNYLTLAKLSLLDTIVGVSLPQFADASAIFRLRQSMRLVPKSLIEAARLDKVPHMTCLTKIVMPLIKSSIASQCIFMFVNCWNEYVWPMLILRNQEMMTITLAMKKFSGSEGSTGWGTSMALATISVALPLVLYLIAQKQIISSFMSSGIKE
ncbi:MAG: carbohydrate ABC transporter permease [Lachnospiraceae bacterium]|nr:carbohydrate ABC transporter permease [Lachnospiraceae bacterium]